MKLHSITFEVTPRIPGLRPDSMSSIDLDNPTEPLRHWRLSMRGPSVFLISPPGWRPGRKPHDWDPAGPSLIHEFPRASCYLHWSGAPVDIETIIKGKYDSEPFGGPMPARPLPAPSAKSILAQLPKEIGDD